jgi:hypothetical protein
VGITQQAANASNSTLTVPWLEKAADWKIMENGLEGKFSLENGLLTISRTDGVNGVGYVGSRAVPTVNYELSWEARRTTGGDFFSAATFPVRKMETCATFINGGWGGSITGVSDLNRMSANENNTTTIVNYEDGKWYRFRVQVTNEMLVAYVDDKKVVNTNITEKEISLRPGDIEYCAPLGFATYGSSGEIRNMQIRNLKPGELPLDPDAY